LPAGAGAGAAVVVEAARVVVIVVVAPPLHWHGPVSWQGQIPAGTIAHAALHASSVAPNDSPSTAMALHNMGGSCVVGEGAGTGAAVVVAATVVVATVVVVVATAVVVVGAAVVAGAGGCGAGAGPPPVPGVMMSLRMLISGYFCPELY